MSREYYINVETFHAMDRADKRRKRRARIVMEIKFWGTAAAVLALLCWGFLR